MKLSKKLIATATAILLNNPVYAGGILVFDGSNLAQAVLQVDAWKKQYEQMVNQFQQLQQQYNNLNGVRGMADLVNNPALRQYLPQDYQTILNRGYGNWESIRASAKIFDINQTSLGKGTDAAKAFEATARQAAINRATAEDGYKQASNRFRDIQVLLDKVNNAPDAKDIADLQARIQAEQVMMQNENTKLIMLGQLAQAQRDLAMQAAAERRMKSTRGAIPNW